MIFFRFLISHRLIIRLLQASSCLEQVTFNLTLILPVINLPCIISFRPETTSCSTGISSRTQIIYTNNYDRHNATSAPQIADRP